MNLKHIALSICLALVSIGAASAQQNTLVQTSLSTAISATVQQFAIASATGVTVSPATMLVVDKEAMLVIALSGTSVTVARGVSGTKSVAHINAAMVLLGRPDWFYTTDPAAAACTAATVYATPYLNVLTGNQFLCSTITLSWVPGWGNTGSGPIQPTAAVASAAGVIVPSGPLFHVTGALAITGFTIPVGYNGGQFCIIPDGAFTTTTAGNIAIASTGVVSKLLCYGFDIAAAKVFFATY